MRQRVLLACAAVAGVAVVAALTRASAAQAGAATPPPGPAPIGGHAMFLVQSWGGKAVRAATGSVPTWNGSFSLGGTKYTYKMVGTNPAGGSKTTTVPTEILPLKVVMANGVTVTGSASKLKASPVLSNAAFTSGTTQLGD